MCWNVWCPEALHPEVVDEAVLAEMVHNRTDFGIVDVNILDHDLEPVPFEVS